MAQKSSKNRNSIIKKILLFFNVIAILLLLLSYLSQYLSPATLWHPAFAGLAYPFFIIINLGFILFWLIMMKKYFLLSLISILIGFNLPGRYFQFNSETNISEIDSTFSLMSYNVHGMTDFVQFYKGKNPEGNGIIEYIGSVAPDIICFQEFPISLNFKKPIDDEVGKFLSLNYYKSSDYQNRNLSSKLITFSKYKIVNSGFLNKHSSRTYAFFTDIVINSDTVRVYNIHLQSIALQSDESIFSGKLDVLDAKGQSEIKQKTKSVAKKLKRAFTMRAQQVIELKSQLLSSPYPLIVCGDFNDTPVSFTYQTLSKNMKDAFIQCGSGTGQTYRGKYPSFRIDYIMYDPIFDSFSFNTDDVDYSDHFPIYCVLKNK